MPGLPRVPDSGAEDYFMHEVRGGITNGDLSSDVIGPSSLNERGEALPGILGREYSV